VHFDKGINKHNVSLTRVENTEYLNEIKFQRIMVKKSKKSVSFTSMIGEIGKRFNKFFSYFLFFMWIDRLNKTKIK